MKEEKGMESIGRHESTFSFNGEQYVQIPPWAENENLFGLKNFNNGEHPFSANKDNK